MGIIMIPIESEDVQAWMKYGTQPMEIQVGPIGVRGMWFVRGIEIDGDGQRWATLSKAPES